jgi:hypothetical protein
VVLGKFQYKCLCAFLQGVECFARDFPVDGLECAASPVVAGH